jgi:hypothetical protein
MFSPVLLDALQLSENVQNRSNKSRNMAKIRPKNPAHFEISCAGLNQIECLQIIPHLEYLARKALCVGLQTKSIGRMMDPTAIIDTYGLVGLVMVGLGWAVVHLWKAFTTCQENRIREARDAAREIREIAQASNSAIDSLSRVLERGGRYDP